MQETELRLDRPAALGEGGAIGMLQFHVWDVKLVEQCLAR